MRRGNPRRRKRNRPFWAPKANARKVHAVGVIPGYMTEARYYREGEHSGHYKHAFKPESKVRMIAMSDGSVWLRGNRRIHADDRRPGFGRYTDGNPGGGRMAERKDSSLMWYLILGVGLYALLRAGSAGAYTITIGPGPGSGGGGPIAVPPSIPGDATPQIDSAGNVVGYYRVNADGTVTTWTAAGVLEGTA